MRQRFRDLLAVCLAVPLALSAESALAAKPKKKDKVEEKAKKQDEEAKKKIAVGGFEGPKSGDARGWTIDALKEEGYDVTDAEDVKPKGKDKDFAEAAKALSVDAIVVGKMNKAFNLKVSIRNGEDGSLIEEFEIKGGMLPKLKKNISDQLAVKAEEPLSQAKGPETEEVEPEEEEEEEEEPAKEEESEEEPKEEEEPEDEGPPQGRLSPLNATLGLRPYNRSLSFHHTRADLFDGEAPLLTYELPLGPALFIDLRWYPGAHFAGGVAGWFGIAAGFEKGFATQSVFAENTESEATLTTDPQQFYVGLHGRVPFGEHQAGLLAAYGKHQFLLGGDEPEAEVCSRGTIICPLVPDIEYSFIRIGLDGQFRFGDFLAGVNAGTRIGMDTGPIRSQFPNARATSMEAGLMGGYRLTDFLDLVVGFDFLRYAFDFNPVDGSAQNFWVAGGAVDQYISGYLGFHFHLPGDPAGDGALPAAASVSASADAEASADEGEAEEEE